MRITILFLIQIVMIHFFSSCSPSNSFESKLVYTSKLNVSRAYHFNIKGTFEEGTDMANSYQGELLIYHDSVLHKIHFKAENASPKLTGFDTPMDFDVYELGMHIDPGLFSALLLKTDPTLSTIYAHKESEELLEALKLIGLGPKIGVKKFKIINLISEDHSYN